MIQILRTIHVLEDMANDLATERNAWLYPPFGEAGRYALLREKAQNKLDAVKEAIRNLRRLHPDTV